MFFRIQPLTLAFALLACAPGVFAASTVELAVTGLITPSACSPSLSSGVIDHGKISAKDIDQDAGKFLKSNLGVTVDCEAQTLFALRGIDNRANSSNAPRMGYGLGLINGTQKIGHYLFVPGSASADGSPITALESQDGGISWGAFDGALWATVDLAAYGHRIDGKWTPVAIQNLETQLDVLTYIAPGRGLDLSNEVVIDGSATLEVMYL